jgi:NADH:ubiquinone oxidoreductase subunit 3 (subunit A)
MYIPKNLSKQFGPVAGIIVGIVILATAAFLFYLVVVSLKTGEIWKISKYNSGFVIRNDSPEQFWGLVVSYSIVGLTVASLSAWILIDAFRGLRR